MDPPKRADPNQGDKPPPPPDPMLFATIDLAKSKTEPSVQIVNGFKLLKRIGSGSFAEVWQGESQGGFPVAVKRIIRPLEDEEAQREQQSLQTIKKLRHMFLLQTIDAFVHQNQLFVVMELADGTLRDRMKQCQQKGMTGIPLGELLTYFRESAEALDYMHGQNLFHRDIKPQNILLLHGHAKVADFGLATLLQSQKMLSSATGSGTPAYMAPEVWSGKISRNTDQYSLAATYAEQRLGRWAISGQDMMSLMVAHVEGKVDLTGLPDAEQTVIRKALSRDPAQRYESCLAFVHTVEESLGDQLGARPGRVRFRPPTTTNLPAGASKQVPGTATTPDGYTHADGGLSPTATLAASKTLPLRPARRWWPFVLLALLFLGIGGAAAWYVAHRYAIPPQAGLAAYALVVPPNRTLHAGEVRKLTIAVERRGYSGPIDLSALDLPPGCEMEQKSIAPNESSIDLKLRVAPDAVPVSDHPVRIQAEADGATEEKSLRLTIEPCWYRFEKNWHKAPDGQLEEHDNNRVYYSRIEVQREGLPVPVRFVLVPQTNAGDPRTFYIMEDKVWLDLFKAFAVKPAAPLKSMAWKDPPINQEGDCPVMGVAAAADAQQFARWLGGELPTTREWDKALGRFEKPRPASPYQGVFKPGGVAVGLTAPMKRGAARQDIGRFSTHDMAGNGREWTSTIAGDDQGIRASNLDKLGEFEFLNVRGKMWNSPQPLSFEEIEKEPESKPALPAKGLPVDNTIGFRVVLELDS